MEEQCWQWGKTSVILLFLTLFAEERMTTPAKSLMLYTSKHYFSLSPWIAKFVGNAAVICVSVCWLLPTTWQLTVENTQCERKEIDWLLLEAPPIKSHSAKLLRHVLQMYRRMTHLVIHIYYKIFAADQRCSSVLKCIDGGRRLKNCCCQCFDKEKRWKTLPMKSFHTQRPLGRHYCTKKNRWVQWRSLYLLGYWSPRLKHYTYSKRKTMNTDWHHYCREMISNASRRFSSRAVIHATFMFTWSTACLRAKTPVPALG